MSEPVISKIVFTVTFPANGRQTLHVPLLTLQSLARQQLNDLEVIETIEHLLKCSRCMQNYRLVRSSNAEVWN